MYKPSATLKNSTMSTSQPLLSTAALDQVRSILNNPRDRALFECGVGTAFRGSDILGLTIRQVQGLVEGDDLVVREKKTTNINKPARRVTLNKLVAEALADLVEARLQAGAKLDDWLFISQSGFKSGKHAALSTVSLTRSWKHWCNLAGIEGQFGSHTGRKSFGYLSRVEDGMSIEVLQKAYGHSSPSITQAYICVQDTELRAIYMLNRTNK